MRRRTKIIIISVVTTIILGLGVAAYLFYARSNTVQEVMISQESEKFAHYTEQIRKEDPQNVDVKSFIDSYGPTFEQTRYEVTNSDPTKWDREMLDKVYFLITYHHQLGEYQSIERLLSQLDEAKAAGIDINNNSTHSDDTYRQQLRNEIDDFRGNNSQTTMPSTNEVKNE